MTLSLYQRLNGCARTTHTRQSTQPPSIVLLIRPPTTCAPGDVEPQPELVNLFSSSPDGSPTLGSPFASRSRRMTTDHLFCVDIGWSGAGAGRPRVLVRTPAGSETHRQRKRRYGLVRWYGASADSVSRKNGGYDAVFDFALMHRCSALSTRFRLGNGRRCKQILIQHECS